MAPQLERARSVRVRRGLPPHPNSQQRSNISTYPAHLHPRNARRSPQRIRAATQATTNFVVTRDLLTNRPTATPPNSPQSAPGQAESATCGVQCAYACPTAGRLRRQERRGGMQVVCRTSAVSVVQASRSTPGSCRSPSAGVADQVRADRRNALPAGTRGANPDRERWSVRCLVSPASPAHGSARFGRRPGAGWPTHQPVAMHQQMHRVMRDVEQVPWRLAQQCLIAAMHAIDQVIAFELRTQHRDCSRELTNALAELFLLTHRDKRRRRRAAQPWT